MRAVKLKTANRDNLLREFSYKGEQGDQMIARRTEDSKIKNKKVKVWSLSLPCACVSLRAIPAREWE